MPPLYLLRFPTTRTSTLTSTAATPSGPACLPRHLPPRRRYHRRHRHRLHRRRCSRLRDVYYAWGRPLCFGPYASPVPCPTFAAVFVVLSCRAPDFRVREEIGGRGQGRGEGERDNIGCRVLTCCRQKRVRVDTRTVYHSVDRHLKRKC